MTESFRRAPGPRPVAFARGAPKAAPRAGGGGGGGGGVAGVIGAIVGSGGCGNGMQNGKRGFQPGNKCAAARNPHVTAAQKAHTAANAITRKHVKAGTLNTPAGRNAVRAAAKAARELRSARETHQAAQKVKYAENAKARRAAAKATAAKPEAQAAAQLQAAHATSVAARATAKPAEKAPAKPPAKPQPSPREQVVAASKEAMSIKAEKAATHLSDLHAGVKAGAIDAPTAHKHVDRIARGVTRDELFAAAKAHGIEHAATTKKALVDHLKAAHSAAAKPAEVARPPAPKVPEAARPKEAAPPKAEAARPAEAAARKLGPAAREIRSIGEDVAAGRLRPDQVRGRVADARRVHGDAAVARAATALGVAHVGGASAAHSLTRHIEGLAGKAATPRAETLPVKDFADRVVKAAHATPAGGFGDQKTMISHVKAHLEKTDPAFRGMSDADFKARLVEAHRARHLELGRADLREAMHPADLRASSTPHLGAEYHFIRHPEAPGKEQSRPPAASKATATVEKRVADLASKVASGRIKPENLDHHVRELVKSEERGRLAKGLSDAGVRGVTEHHTHAAIARAVASHVRSAARQEQFHREFGAAKGPEARSRLATDYVASRLAGTPRAAEVPGMAPGQQFRSFEHGGVRMHVPATATIDAGHPAVQLVHAHAERPLGAVTRDTRDIYFSDHASPADAKFAERFGKANFKSAATAHGSSIAVHGRPKVPTRDVVAHEGGHNIATRLYGSVTPREGSDFHRAASSGEAPPGAYAAKHPAEDFAESVKHYHADPARFAADFPRRHAVIRRILEDRSYGG